MHTYIMHVHTHTHTRARAQKRRRRSRQRLLPLPLLRKITIHINADNSTVQIIPLLIIVITS